MSDIDEPPELVGVLVRLRQALLEASLPFVAEDAQRARAEREALLKQLDDYIVPRLVQVDAPLLAVVGGSTGAGKSTLVNSLVGESVTHAGVLRPTTRSPVLVHNPDDAGWFGADRLLPDLERTDHMTNDQGTLQLVASGHLPAGIALLDAPDVDSVEERNRQLAAQLLAAADLWIFVTSASRYADQVPWEFLRDAAKRGTSVAIVLDRTTPRAVREVSSHLARMLTARGLGGSPMFTVPEEHVDSDGLLPSHAVAPIRSWLESLARNADQRSSVVRTTLDGALTAVGPRARLVASAMQTQQQLHRQLRQHVETAYSVASADVRRELTDATLVEGPVMAAWQEFASSGGLQRALEDRTNRFRGWLIGVARGRPSTAERVMDVVETALRATLLLHAESASRATAEAWRESDAGRHLAEGSGGLEHGTGIAMRAGQVAGDWLRATVALVRAEGRSRGATHQFLADGVNGVATALVIVVLAQLSDDASDRRVNESPEEWRSVARSAAVVANQVLVSVFGEAAVRRLARDATADLEDRVATQLWQPERERFLGLIAIPPVHDGASERILALSREVDDVRWAARQA